MHDLTRACVSAVTAGALCGVFGMTFAGLRDAVSQVSITDDVDDPAVWGQVYPLYYELYKKSVDMQRTKHGGSEAVPRTPTGTDPRTMVSRSKVEEDIGLRTMWQGYPFAVDFREERGHAYMLEDQTYTMRQQVAPQPGACLMMLPMVTGSRLPMKKFSHVRFGKSAAVLPIEVQNESGAPVLMNIPIGMK